MNFIRIGGIHINLNHVVTIEKVVDVARKEYIEITLSISLDKETISRIKSLGIQANDYKISVNDENKLFQYLNNTISVLGVVQSQQIYPNTKQHSAWSGFE